MAEPTPLPYGPIAMNLCGGLALFLFGMDQLAGVLKAAAGERLKSAIARLTANRFRSFFTGFFVTAALQSSSATTVLLIGFLSAGLMTLRQSVGVILGADVGTTITVQAVAFHVAGYALWLVATGFLVQFLGHGRRWRPLGGLLLGVGLVFYGMDLMGTATAPLKDHRPFQEFMLQMDSPLYGVLAGTAFTAVVQASSATIGIVIVLAAQGLVSLPAGLALVMGANIGTCSTALLAAIGKPREAVRAAFLHVAIKVIGVLACIGLIPWLAALVVWISPAGDAGRQIANAHTVFNLLCAAALIGCVTPLTRLAGWLLPDRPGAAPEAAVPKYLADELLDTPPLALDRARMETRRLCERVQKMLALALPAITAGREEDLVEVGRLNTELDALYHALVEYLGKLSLRPLRNRETRELMALLAGINHLENVGDLIALSMVDLARRRREEGAELRPEVAEKLREFHEWVVKATVLSHQALTENDARAARAVIAMKQDFNELADATMLQEARHLASQDPRLIHAYTTLIETMDKLKRIFYYARRTARRIVPKDE